MNGLPLGFFCVFLTLTGPGTPRGIFVHHLALLMGVSCIAYYMTALATSHGRMQPSSWAMMLLGFAGLGYAGYRRAREPRAAASIST